MVNTTVELLGNEDPSFYFKTQALSYKLNIFGSL
jgi:hypothetical protein